MKLLVSIIHQNVPSQLIRVRASLAEIAELVIRRDHPFAMRKILAQVRQDLPGRADNLENKVKELISGIQRLQI